MKTEFLRIQLLVFVAACTTAASGATQITLRGKVEMTRHLVRLGDVAEVVCDDAAEAGELASLPLMPAPAPGSQRYVPRREIEDALAAHGFDMKTLKVGGAPRVTILGARSAAPRGEAVKHREAAKVIDVMALNERIRQLISGYLKTKSAEAAGWMVKCDVPQRHLASLAAATAQPVCSGGSAPWTGRQRFEISFATAEGNAKFSIFADVTPATTPVVVATRALARGEVVTAADVELQDVGYVAKSNDRRAVVRSIDAILGMEARQPIPAGSMIYSDAVQPPVMVKRGELIHVSSQSGGIRVRTMAKALQDRSHGQLVEVESLTTKQRFDARVVGPGEAVVAVATMPAGSARTAPVETVRR